MTPAQTFVYPRPDAPKIPPRDATERLGPLDDLAERPHLVAELRPEQVEALINRCAALQCLLAARLLSMRPHRPTPDVPVEPDRLLTPEAAASRLNVSVRWLYRHAHTLPFTRRLSRKRLRFSEAGLRRYMATRPA